jgi:hypothetical protein
MTVKVSVGLAVLSLLTVLDSYQLVDRSNDKEIESQVSEQISDPEASYDAASPASPRVPDRGAAVQSNSEYDFRTAAESLLSSDGSTALPSLRRLMHRWCGHDPQAAADWGVTISDASVRREILEQVAITWADKDLGAVAKWVKSLPQGEERNVVTFDVAYEANRTDPRIALELANQLPSTSERDDLIEHAFSQWAETDFPSSWTWANKVSDLELRERLLATALITHAGHNAREAASLVATVLKPGEEQSRALVAVVQRWAEESPDEAWEWATQLPEGSLRTTALENTRAIRTVRDVE